MFSVYSQIQEFFKGVALGLPLALLVAFYDFIRGLL